MGDGFPCLRAEICRIGGLNMIKFRTVEYGRTLSKKKLDGTFVSVTVKEAIEFEPDETDTEVLVYQRLKHSVNEKLRSAFEKAYQEG